MGGKLKDTTLLSEPGNEQQEIKGKKKNKDKKNKHRETETETEVQNELNPKRKLEATETEGKKKKKKKCENGTYEENPEGIAGKNEAEQSTDGHKKKKNKKHKEENENGKVAETHEGNQESKSEDDTQSYGKEGDGKVVTTGKNVEEAKYKPLKSFTESKLPDNVLECCKNFKNPSPIQSHAWPFLLDGRDFIGIAKTGSGRFFFSLPKFM